VATGDLGTVLRGLGKNLTEEEVGDLTNSFDKDGSGKLDFDTLYTILSTHQHSMRGAPVESEVLANMSVFDTYKTGLISVPDLVHVLLNLGEPLTREDVENLMLEIEVDGDNQVNIAEFVRYMYDTSMLDPNPPPKEY
jgi:Ca2+-binding EF-hand superfamily protein